MGREQIAKVAVTYLINRERETKTIFASSEHKKYTDGEREQGMEWRICSILPIDI